MAIVAQKVGAIAGTAPTFAAPAASETVPVGTLLVVKNASAASVNVTLVTPGTLATGDAYPDKVYAVPAGQELWIPVLGEYMDPVSRVASVTFSATASVTAAAIVLA
jgi:hypothetical protein